MTSLPTTPALWLLVAVLPTAIFVVWDDLVHLKIRNAAVFGMFLTFLIVGLLTLPITVVFWQACIALLVLVLGLAGFAAGLIPGGDAKYIAAISPFFNWSDWALIAILYLSAILATLLLRWLALQTPLPKATANWAVWRPPHRIPLGVPLTLVLMLYLGLSIAGKVPA